MLATRAELRTLSLDDIERAVSIWSVAFNYTPEDRELRKQFAYLHPEWLRGVFQQRKLLAVLRLYPFRAYLAGRGVELGGIASVATAPEARRRGLAESLLRGALEEMRERGIPWSGLWPFSAPFYARYGYATCHHNHVLRLQTRDLPAARSSMISLERLPLEVTPSMHSVYRAWAPQYNLNLDRHPDFWRMVRLHSGSLLFGARGKSALEGFLQLSLSKQCVRIEDFCWSTPEAAHSLLELVRGFSGQAQELMWEAPTRQEALSLDSIPGPVEIGIRRGMMARIVDLPQALISLPVPEGRGRLEFELSDETAPWNAGRWCYEWEGGSALCERSGSSRIARLQVQTLTQLLTGYTTPAIARAGGHLEGPELKVPSEWCRPIHVADYF
ncbi:MAG: UPF0256 protein [Candidatus Xenobia bacterium]